MIHKIFTIYDEKAESYLPPFFLPNAGMAKRTFGDCVKDEKHAFGQHPSDYTLMELGTYDDQTGTLNPNEKNKSLGNGLEYAQEELFELPEAGYDIPRKDIG